MAIHSNSSIQNTFYRRFWIRRNKCIINLINNQPDIDKIYLYAKDTYETKYQYLIKKFLIEKAGLNYFNDPKALMDYSNNLQDVYKNIVEYKNIIVSDDMIADMINNKKLNPVLTELFIRGRKRRGRNGFYFLYYIILF